MKNKKNLIAISCFLFLGISYPVNAEWKQDNKGWCNTERSSWSTGWKYINNNWYFFDANGYMKTGWINNNGQWYYLLPSGEMAKNTWIDEYFLNDNGQWIQEKRDFVTFYYQKDNLEIKTYFEGIQTLEGYKGMSLEDAEMIYGTLIVNAKDYNMTKRELLERGENFKIIKENGEIKLKTK